MNVEQILTDLKAERDKLTRAIEALEGIEMPRTPKVSDRTNARTPRGKPGAKLIACTEPGCQKVLTVHGMDIHRSRVHGIKAKHAAYTKKHQKRDQVKGGQARCIDCGLGPFDMDALDRHLETCSAFALANRSNGRH